MTPRLSLHTLFAALVAVSALSACGGGSSAPAETIPSDAGLVVKNVKSIRFDASEYSATAGDIKVAFVNEDTVRHTLLIAQDGVKVPNFKLVVAEKGALDVGNINLAAGSYTLICDVPGHQNMKATLTVS
ncbi:MAG: plastocyanin/azurin family copper-binding protein [Ilumatobacteraceae bacterium]|jgi:plastocyanin|nr:plastocyanin/azurin family copper-binding protein [Ilumatobacteraceae bacterium]MDP4701734.1 plastocyanin/azurin family copper-binding protein [Ilumatobacteraceae bacterium]